MRANARLPLFAAAGCWAAFLIVLVVAYVVGPAERLDAIALHGLSALRGPWADPFAHFATHLADPAPLLVLLVGVIAWGWAIGRRRQAIAAAALVGGANVATQILKVALAHPRIQPALGPYQLGPEAFPSGHATAAMSLGLAAVLISPTRWRAIVASAATVYVIAVCTSILVLSWHFPSDVLGGLLVASGFFFSVVAGLRAFADSERAPALRTGAILTPRLLEAGMVALAGLGVLALARAEDLLTFARLHTMATAAALALMAIAAALLAAAALVADEYP
jgi:membrane-associated phospholipid phosphatase